MKILTEIIVTSFYIGKLPLAPGSWASAIATISWLYFFDDTNSHLLPFYTFALLILGTFFSYLSLKHSNDYDPSYIVIDEWVGQWIALSFLPVSASYGLIAFVLFRFFDISKFKPVGYIEKLPGAFGVMLDDVVAGILTVLIIFAIRFLLL